MPLRFVHIPFVVFAAVLVYYSLRLSRHFRQALSTRVPPTEAVAGWVEDPPEHLAIACGWIESRLLALGFAFHSRFAIVRAEGQPQSWQVAYEHAGLRIYVLLCLLPTYDLTRSFQIFFRSYLGGGRTITTFNCGRLPAGLDAPGHTAFACRAPALQEHLAAHLRNTEGTGDAARSLSAQEMVGTQNELIAAELAAILAQGLVQREGDTAFRRTPRHARGIALREVFAAVLDGRAERQRRQLAAAAPVEVWVSHYHWLRLRQQLATEPSSTRAGNLLVFGLSLVAFAWSLGYLSPLPLLSIVTALLVHETGHLVAMRLVGYRNTRILFLPFMGAVATGLPGRSIGAAQAAFVYLMGPVTGLFVTACLWAAGRLLAQTSLLSAAVFFLVINAFNLLPVMPLDGGRLTLLVVPGRSAWRRVSIFVASAAAAVVLAVLLRSPSLALLALLALLMLRRQIPLAAALAGSTRGGPELGQCFKVLNGARFAALPFGAKFYVAREYEELVSQMRWSQWLSACLLLYVAAVCGSGYALFALFAFLR